MTSENTPIRVHFQHGPLATPSDYQGALDGFARIRVSHHRDSEHSRALESMLSMMIRLDQQFGTTGPFPIDGVQEALAEAISAAARVESDSSGNDAAILALDRAVIALAHWATQHVLEIRPPDIWVNALARRANAAETRQDCAAVFALMQGAIAHLEPALAAGVVGGAAVVGAGAAASAGGAEGGALQAVRRATAWAAGAGAAGMLAG